jgi:glycine/D-amino acid oxidase-like deaminating enzyme
LPLIGPVADRPWLWVAAGHEGLGITTSLATAELIADGLAGRSLSLPPEPYLPTRVIEAGGHGHE